MPRGASPEREQEYKKLERKFKQEHRYPGREDEVAARIVNKQRSAYGETKEEKRKDSAGESPDRNLPIRDYQKLTAAEIDNKLKSLSEAELRQIRGYESSHKNRKGVLQKLERRLNT